tara:strand:- start:48 stop:470 length:423 start_codon:yes stop_codon:yes gene_type:complete
MIKITDLQEASSLWCNKNIQKFDTNEIFYISSNIILDNLYYRPMLGVIALLKDEDYYYRKIYDDIQENGWNVEYPSGIGIGERGEVFVHGGNHRMNMITQLEPMSIPFKFRYVTNYREKVPTFLEDGRNFYPNGLLPKWK